MTLEVVGLIFNFIASLILIIVAFVEPGHQKNYIEGWRKKYWWMGWRPIMKISPPDKKAYWKVKLKHTAVRYGAIPPRHQWNTVGFLYMLIGFLLQLISYFG